MQNTVLKHKSDAKVYQANLLSLSKLSIQDRHDGGHRVSSLFEGISMLNWEDGKFKLNYYFVKIVFYSGTGGEHGVRNLL